MKKRPAFQFYPADWRKDAALQSCSLAARGLWHELICVMHECRPYGNLALNGKPMAAAKAAQMVGIELKVYSALMTELAEHNVFGKTKSGMVFSRRMVRDERLRNTRAKSGKKGGNPALLKQKHLDNHEDNHPDNLPAETEITPSTSSSTSSSNLSSSTTTAPAVVGPDGPPECPHEAIVELYHEILSGCPRILDWTTARQGYLRSRWREKAKPNGTWKGYTTVDRGLAWWRRFFEWVSQSDFLTGKTDGRQGRPPFVADLEWLLRPSNFTKVIEGRYHR